MLEVQPLKQADIVTVWVWLQDRLIIMRFHAHQVGVIILAPETAGSEPGGLNPQYEAMNVALSVPQGTHYCADVICLYS